jgi:hypothetical protein
MQPSRAVRAVPKTEFDRRYDALKRRLILVGCIAEGSLAKRFITCGNPACRCRKNPEQRHGPYFQLTWKRKGKTVSRFIPPSLAPRFQRWIENRRTMESIIEQMYALSLRAIEADLATVVDKKEKAVILSVKKTLRAG